MKRAIIIGGGPGGLSAALAVRRAGFEPIVYEAAPALREVGSGVTLWANALSACEVLGVSDALLGAGEPFAGIAMKRAGGERLFQVPSAGAGGIGWAAALHRAELQRLLVDAVGSDAIRVNARCVAVGNSGRGVSARFENGDEVEGDLLLGADGLHSRVRAAVAGDDPLRWAGYRVWRGVAGLELVDRIGVTTLGRGAQFGMFPMSGARTYWFASLSLARGVAASARPRDWLLQHFASWHAPIASLIDATDDESIVCTEILDRKPLPRWVWGRVALLGDAAHPAVPTLGQGACQAIEDAATLSNCLLQERDVASALSSYQERRLRRANSLSEEARRIGQVGQWRHPAACAIRDWMIRSMPESLRRRQLGEMLHYRA